MSTSTSRSSRSISSGDVPSVEDTGTATTTTLRPLSVVEVLLVVSVKLLTMGGMGLRPGPVFVCQVVSEVLVLVLVLELEPLELALASMAFCLVCSPSKAIADSKRIHVRSGKAVRAAFCESSVLTSTSRDMSARCILRGDAWAIRTGNSGRMSQADIWVNGPS